MRNFRERFIQIWSGCRCYRRQTTGRERSRSYSKPTDCFVKRVGPHHTIEPGMK